jgi:uncharacterized protein YkwD
MYTKITAALGVLILISVIGVITYNEMTQEHVTVLVEMSQDADPINVLSQFPGQITNVKSIDRANNAYEVKIVSQHTASKLLEILRNLTSIKDAKLKEPLPQSTIFTSALLEAHNKERKKEGLPPLIKDDALCVFAQAHAQDMADRQRLEHQSLKSLMDTWQSAGENIACGQEDVPEVMDAWMHSSGHKRNILNKEFTHVGFGETTTKTGVPYWCVDFGGK